jgi:DNA polymerase III alpha subunit (gram-positive type)
MAALSLNEIELFNKLREQIKLEVTAENEHFFTDAKVNKVVVHQRSRVWQFHLEFADILPYPLFIDLGQHLQQAFSEIAKIKLTIQTRSPQLTDQNFNAVFLAGIVGLGKSLQGSVIGDGDRFLPPLSCLGNVIRNTIGRIHLTHIRM